MLKTFDLQTEGFNGNDYQQNKYAKVFSIPRSILHADTYAGDIHLVFSVYWLSNYHYSRCGTYSLTVTQGLDGCSLCYLGDKGRTYLENGVCYKITDNDIEVYVRPSANSYHTRIVIEGNSKFYLYGKYYDGAFFEDIDVNTLTPCEIINKNFDELIYDYLSTTPRSDVVTSVSHNTTKQIYSYYSSTKKILNCNLKIVINSVSSGNGKIFVNVNGTTYDSIPVSYKNGDEDKYINITVPIKDGGSFICQYYHYNNNGDGCTVTVTPTTN